MILWDVEKGKERGRLPKLADSTALAVGPGGRFLAAGRADGIVLLWDVSDGRQVRVMSSRLGPVAGLAFSRDGRLLASCGADHAPGVWETATGQELLAPEGHGGPATCVLFSPDGRALLSGGGDGLAFVWALNGQGRDAPARAARLTTADLDKRWNDLLNEDGAVANRALWDLAAASDQSAPFLRDRLGPLLGGDVGRASKLIADLDSDDFDTREKASTDLAAMGQAVEPLLRRAFDHTESTEARQRLQVLLGKLKTALPWAQQRPRVLRALAALELSGAPAARELLEAVAKGALEPEVKQAAREALDRLPKP